MGERPSEQGQSVIHLIYRSVMALALGLAVLAPGLPANAMKMTTEGDKLTIEGSIEEAEVFRFIALLDELKDQIKTVVFHDSPGGNLDTSYRVAQLIRQRGLGTAVSGYCASGCGIMFMGGVRRQLADENVGKTFVGFHGAYDQYGAPHLGSLPFLKKVLVSYADGKADEALIDRWMALRPDGLIYFFDSERMRRKSDSASTFLCRESPKGAFDNCEGLPNKTGYDLGIFTSKELLKLKDDAPTSGATRRAL
jgi:hypothetical protein